MRKSFIAWSMLALGLGMLQSCQEQPAASPTPDNAGTPLSGQSGVKDDQSQKDVVKIAVGSPDHTTLVKALQQAEYVDALSNAGPFTVFAPTNAAFDKLPSGTLEELMKPENKDKLRSILEYHVYVGVLKTDFLKDGQRFGQASGENISITMENGKPLINGHHILASIPASNGIIHVVDGVLLPPAK